jgi:hypothetical protein
MEKCKNVIVERQTIDSLIELEAKYDGVDATDEKSYKERLARTRYNSVSKAEVSLDSVKSRLLEMASLSPDKGVESMIEEIDSSILFYQNAMFHCCDDNGSSGR